jgi:8-hydroxy-5-deazaflavin:NADPH oxidoreductase
VNQPDSFAPRRIAVLGAGQIGLPIGRHWLAAGHQVTFGSRDPQRLKPLIEPWGESASAATYAEAAANADVALLSVPFPALDDLLAELGGPLSGKVVLDATNPMGLSEQGRIISTLGDGLTQGRRTAKLLPDSAVARAFSHVMDELLWSRGSNQRHFWGMALAADDESARDAATALVHDAGFVPVDLGGLDDSAALDPGGALFPHMFTPADLRVAAAFSI